MKPHVIAICHHKGGVAKTTTVSALGAALAEDNHSTLLIDMDPSGNLTAGLGFKPRQVKKSITDTLLGNAELDFLSQSTDLPELSIIPSSPDLAAASQVLGVRPNYESILSKGINQLRHPYEIVIIDCPPSMATLTTVGLTAANLAIIPMQCEYFSIQAISTILGYIRRIRNEYNSQLDIKILITMYDRRGKLHIELFERLKSHYTTAIFETIIGFDSKLRYSQIAGQPITKFAPKTRATEQYRNLAKEIFAYVQERRILQPN